MSMATTGHARDCLRNALIYDFMRPDQMAWAPIRFPGIVYADDGTLTDQVKAKGTQHLIAMLRDRGYVIKFSDETDVLAALHRVLWDHWTQDELGKGRFIGRLFDDHGQIYKGSTADEAAIYVLERLTVLGGALYSYTIQEDGPQ